MTQTLTAKHIRTALLWLAFAIVAGTIFYYWESHLWPIFSDRAYATQVIRDAGFFGPLIFIAIQIIQVVIAPVPGQVAGLLGGYLFGTWLGLLYSLIGATLGFTFVFLLARRFGRPLIERFFDAKHISRFDFMINKNGPFALFLVFLLPVFPDDLICYLAGLTRIPIRQLVVISLAGRLPGYLLLSMTGNGWSLDNLNFIIAMALGMLLLVALAVWQRHWLYAWLQSDNHWDYFLQNWHLSPRATWIWLIAVVLVFAGLILFGMSDISLS
jgi:uncharacterized membrane protein YdjX (TVP38/TMEM64 family)